MGSPTIFSGRRTKLLTADGLLLSDGSINDNNGLINYIKNGHAEVNTTGWSTFADGATLVDGTGGSPTATFTRSTSSPLRGSASFLYTPGTLGDGASYPFTIDESDKAKVLRISVDYQLSGTITLGDYQVYVYDVTNSQLIQPAPFKLDGTSGTTYTFNGSFQTSSNSTSYRLIIWQSVSTAVTLKLDNLAVSPQVVSIGGSVGDWQSYTPTYTGFGTVTNIGMYWRRIGDSIQLRGRFTLGTVTASEARVGLPSGLTSASTISTVEICGSVTRNTAGSATPDYQTLIEPSVTYVTFGLQSTTTAGLSKVNGNGLAGTGEILSITATLPIAGWGTSQIMSSEADTRVCAARVVRTSTQSISTAAATKIAFNSASFDTHAAFDVVTNNRFVAPISGYFKPYCELRWNASMTGASDVQLMLYKNGSLFSYLDRQVGTANMAMKGSDILWLNAGEYIEFFTQQNSGGALSTEANCFAIVERLSGPSQVASSESMSALYVGTATGTLNTSFNTVTLPTKVKDSHNAYSSGSYTIQTSGCFSISGQIAINGTWALDGYAQLSIFVDGVEKYTGQVETGGNQTYVVVPVSVQSVPLLAGQVVTIRSRTSATSPIFLSSSTQHWFSIARVGNY